MFGGKKKDMKAWLKIIFYGFVLMHALMSAEAYYNQENIPLASAWLSGIAPSFLAIVILNEIWRDKT